MRHIQAKRRAAHVPIRYLDCLAARCGASALNIPALERFGTAADGRLFRGTRGGMLSESVYGRAWHAARHAALGPGLAATALALGIAAWAVIEGRRAWAGTTCRCATCQ